MQQAHGVIDCVIRAEGIGTHQFGKGPGLMGWRTHKGPHFMQNHDGA